MKKNRHFGWAWGASNILNVWWVYSPAAGEQFYQQHHWCSSCQWPLVCLIASNRFLQYENWTVTSLIWTADVIIWPIGELGQRQTAFPEKPTFAGVHVKQASFFFLKRHLFLPCSSLLQPAAITLCWLSGVQTVMISLPPLPDEPLSFCGGKGWFNSSQLRALQHCWQACLPQYAMHTSVHVCVHACTCVHVVEVLCVKLKRMTRAPLQ